MRIKSNVKSAWCLLLSFCFCLSVFSQKENSLVKMGKGWSYISGTQRAINDSNRVNYLIGTEAPFGKRVNNFHDMEPYYKDDSEFLNAHLSPSEVYESSKTADGSAFFISQTELSNLEYRKFVEFCIAQWMKQNRPEIVEKYKWDSPEYVQAVQAWLESSLATSAASEGATSATVLAPATQWGELYLRKLDWGKITYNGSSIFPNTQVWISDFMMSYNEPMRDYYFVHPAYNNYPVVGVNWKQANAFCEWRTQYLNTFLESKKRPPESDFRLPTEAEWEYAARGGRSQSMFPWGNYYLRNRKGCLLANFKPGRGNYPEDGGFYTVRADGYWPNDFGLYCMAGNVAEWTSSLFYEGSYNFQHDMNPDVRFNAKESDPPRMKRKVIRGGSWKDVGYYLQTSTRNYEYMDNAKSYIGFRCALTHLGRSSGYEFGGK